MCSSWTEVGYVDQEYVDQEIAYEQSLLDRGCCGYPDLYRSHPELCDCALDEDRGYREWHTGATYRSSHVEYVDSEVAWKEAIEAGIKLAQEDPSRRVFAREMHWCSGTEIERTIELTASGPVNEWKSSL